MSVVDTHPTCFRIPDGATLLLVDDDSFVRRALRRMIEVEGTSVVEAGDGEEALRVIARDEAQMLDAVVTDLAMPGISGPELISVLLECCPALPVVAMSALAQLPPDLPPVPLLHKPFGAEELTGAVAPLVVRSRAMKRRAQQMRADAAETRSLAAWQHAIARKHQARFGELMNTLRQIRHRMTRR